MTPDLTDQIVDITRRHGVDMVGFARVEALILAHPPRPAGELLPGARSVVALAAGLLWGTLNSPSSRGAVKDALLAYQRLEQAAAEAARLLEAGGHACYLPPASMPVDYHRRRGRRYPVAEWSHRQAAVAAGLGVRGTNNLLVTPQLGPYVRLTSFLTTAALPPSEHALPKNLCNGCNLCVEACPVDALTAGPGAPRLNTTRCLTNYIRPFLCPTLWQTARRFISPGGVLAHGIQVLLEGYHFSCAECMRVCPRGGLEAREKMRRRLKGGSRTENREQRIENRE